MRALLMAFRSSAMVAFALCVAMGTARSAVAQSTVPLNTAALGEAIGQGLFGSYGPMYLITGKATPRTEWQLTPQGIKRKDHAPSEGLLSPAMRRLSGNMRNGNQRPKQPQRRPANYTRFDHANLAVNVPTSGWERVDAQERGAKNCLVLSRSQPEMVISLAAEPVGIEKQESNSTVLAASQEKMLSLPGGVVHPGVWKVAAPGLEGRAYQAGATFDTGKQLHYAMWVATKNGYKYSLAVYGDAAQQQVINKTMGQFVGRLRQVQPNRVAHSQAGATVVR